MEDEQPIVAGRRNRRGVNAESRAEALQRLKALRQGGGRRSEASGGGGGFQVKIEAPIYDTIDEDEYEDLVAKRREQVKNFIVDDDGLGYGDEGEEVDWSQAGGPLSSEDDSEGEREKKRKKKKIEKKETAPKKSVLADAAALMGRQRISNIFTSSGFTKSDKVVKLSDSILDNVIAESAPDEADRERRRRRHAVMSPGGAPIAPPVSSILSNQRATIDVRSTISEALPISLPRSDTFEEKELPMVSENGKGSHVETVVPDLAPVDSLKDESEEIFDPVLKEDEKVYALNAKIKEEKVPAFSATAMWQEIGNEDKVGKISDVSPSLGSEGKREFEIDSDGSLPFYFIDAHEEYYGSNAGNIYLFGKVKAGHTYQSCCVVVRNMQRCVYAIPNGSVFEESAILKLERDVEDSKISRADFHTKLHEMASGLKADITKQLLDRNVSGFSMTPVKRNYTFERFDIPHKETYVLKINYPFKDPPLPSDLMGETFRALLGTHSSALELFLIKRKMKGPSWLSISKYSGCFSPQRVTWCKFEVIVDCPKDIRVASSSISAVEIPPVVVTAINLKTIINEKQNVNEIVSASVICCHKTKIDTPMLESEWRGPGMLSRFTVVRKIEGVFPMGFAKEAANKNAKAGSTIISFEDSERALLNRLMIELHKLDSDVLVGHNISGFDLDILLHRVQACKVPSNMWSKIGRLKRSVMPKLTKGSTIFGSGASPGIMSCIAGRLLCDTYLCSRDLLKEVSYSLTELAKTQLNKNRKEIAPHDIPRMFESSDTLMELIGYGETDAWLSMALMSHLSVLPVTRQLTNISGNLWGKTLQGARANRVEYLLLHAFHAKKFIVPDKFSSYPKETKMTKHKLDGPEEKENEDMGANDTILENEFPQKDHEKTKKGPAYAGGLVLEPKRGLYDKYILLLDFNSLYPSIIQEYNICFTTVERSQDGLVPRLPSTNVTGVLPELLKNLVDRRKRVKQLLKNASGLKYQQFDIQQQALKLTANSMYGCLGFSNSRFYAKPLAELITLQGREILQNTVDLVQNNLNLEVIYGDTDSIMINSGLDDIAKAKAIAGNVIREVNKRYKRLEIDLDGLYKRMLLLKKKKYAAVKEQFREDKVYKVIERKGLDMVRRDWSLLSKETGDFCLEKILSDLSCEEVVESIHNELRKVQEGMRNGQIALEKYIITKTLTKPPEAYPDAKSQPHVEVALRLKKLGLRTGCSAGDTVPYIICCEQGNSSGSSAGIAQRARHPDELKKDNGAWMIDIDYYLAQQIHPVVSRLCASIEGTSPACLADCLGLDPSKFQNKSSEVINTDNSVSLLGIADIEERYHGCEPLVLSCPSCSGTFDCPSIFGYICSSISEKPIDLQGQESDVNFWNKLCCLKCSLEISPASIANQVKRQAERFISTYYKASMTCDDETCNYTTRSLNLRVIGDSERGTVCPNYPRCNGRLVRKYSEADLYKQISYFCHILDTECCIEKIEAKTKMHVQKELARITPFIQLAASTVQKIRDCCAYGWIQLNDLIVAF